MDTRIDAVTTHIYTMGLPMNRMSPHFRDRIVSQLGVLLRHDPGASDGTNICRLFNPSINTYFRVFELLRTEVGEQNDLEVHLSNCTLTLVVQEYLRKSSCKTTVKRTDHNASTIYKQLHYQLLTADRELKKIRRYFKVAW